MPQWQDVRGSPVDWTLTWIQLGLWNAFPPSVDDWLAAQKLPK